LTIHFDGDELAACVQCGLCLPECPTWRLTGEERRSPRGRISLMRSLDEGVVGLTEDGVVEAIESCLQCRGCEPACPSGVAFGHLMTATRQAMVDTTGRGRVRAWERLGYRALASPRVVRATAIAAAVAQRLHVLPRRVGLGRLPIRVAPLAVPDVREPARGAAWVLRGCVMDAVQRDVHQDTVDVLVAAGFAPRLATPHEGCCGALAEHAGLTALALEQATRVMRSMPGDDPVVVDSAGCGAQLKDLGRLIGTEEARRFSARVVDACELLAGALDSLPHSNAARRRVIVADPCHLRHVQRVHASVRTLLEPYADVVELDDGGRCCGAAGAFSMQRPADAAAIREEKIAAIGRAGGGLVVSANPGCHLHLAAAGVDVMHPVSLVATCIRGG
jgi:glycolate oxidase iron-sulfur subunit